MVWSVEGAVPQDIEHPFRKDFAGTVRRTIADHFDDVTVSVKDFGAVGDGVTNDTAAFQKAIDAVQRVKGKILVPLGIYLVGSLSIGVEGQRYSCEIVGESWNGDIAQSNTGGVTLSLIAGTNRSMFEIASTAAPCRFDNLNLQGNKSQQTGIVQGGPDRSYAVWFLDYTTNSNKQRSGHFYNCRIEGFASGGIRVGLLRNAGTLNRCTILNCGRTETGTAQGGAASTITLSGSASSTNDTYNTMQVLITGGTGKGQKRTISAYVGATRVATVDTAWEINPDSTSTYSISLVLGDGILLLSNNDWRLTDCDIGGNTRNGIYNTGAGSLTCKNTASFTNWQNGIQNDSSSMDLIFLGGSLDTNYENGAWMRGNVLTPSVNYPRVFNGTRFNQNGLGQHNTFSDIKLTNEHQASAIGCFFIRGTNAATNGRYVKYLVEFAGTSEKMVWSGNTLVVTGTDSFETGTAQAGAAGSITLASSASSTTDFYRDANVTITGGTGAGQTRIGGAYNGSTKILAVTSNWTTPPDNTSQYKISPQVPFSTAMSSDNGKLQMDSQMHRSGEYTPSSSGQGISNIQSLTFGVCMWMQIGNYIQVWGGATVDPTAAASTQFGIPLPVPSNFSLSSDCRGTATQGAVTQVGIIFADPTNDRAQCNFIATDTNSQTMNFQFMYRIR